MTMLRKFEWSPVMLETESMTKLKFKENFITDWRKILGKNHVIQKLENCDFSALYEWHQKERKKKKQMTSELSRRTKGGDVAENVVVYQHANKKVAIISNHQCIVSKSHSAQMTRLDENIDELKLVIF